MSKVMKLCKNGKTNFNCVSEAFSQLMKIASFKLTIQTQPNLHTEHIHSGLRELGVHPRIHFVVIFCGESFENWVKSNRILHWFDTRPQYFSIECWWQVISDRVCSMQNGNALYSRKKYQQHWTYKLGLLQTLSIILIQRTMSKTRHRKR